MIDEKAIKTPSKPKEDKIPAGALVKSDWFEKHRDIGMKNVDPADIKPPQILLMQKSSKLGEFVTKNGESPKVGQFFHTTKLEILENFEAHILIAIKGRYVNRRAKPPEEGDQYQVVGAMANDMSLFGMNFRGTAYNALGGLFSTAHQNKRPMYSIKIRIESRFIQGQVNDWFIPVVRIVELVEDKKVIDELTMMAIGMESRTDDIVNEFAKAEAKGDHTGRGDAPGPTERPL